MKAVFIVPGPDGGRAELRETAAPQIGPGKVLVRVRAAGVNRGELIVMAGARCGEPRINGIEFAGTVVAIGAGATGWAEGDRVMGHGFQSMAEYVAVDPRALMSVPPSMSFAEAAAIPNVFVTSHDALVTHGRLAKGDSVLVTGGSSGVGTAVIQVARSMGAATIVASSRGTQKLARLRELGATHAIAPDGRDWAGEVLEATGGRGVDVVIDTLGAPVFADALKVMALGGRLVSVGRTAGTTAEIDLDLLSARRLEVIGVTFRTRTPEQALACVVAARNDLQAAIDHGTVIPVVADVFPVEDIAAAHARLASNAHVGKIVVAFA